MRRRRPVGRPAAGRLPARHLSLVLGRRADPVVVARPAHGAVLRRAEGARARSPRTCATRATKCASIPLFPEVMQACAGPRRGRSRNLARRGHGRPPTSRCTAPGTRTRSKPGARAAGRRALRRGHRPHVLRRIDVLARNRRLQGGAGRPGGGTAPARHAAHRLPACAPRCWPRWAPARSRGGSFCVASQHW